MITNFLIPFKKIIVPQAWQAMFYHRLLHLIDELLIYAMPEQRNI